MVAKREGQKQPPKKKAERCHKTGHRFFAGQDGLALDAQRATRGRRCGRTDPGDFMTARS
jgi:hypothetical protein